MAKNNLKIIGQYVNGNYIVTLFNDGTKIRLTDCDKLEPKFAESCDLKITSVCDGGCPYCYENCTVNGKHGDLNSPFLDSLKPFTELAINGNDLTHPDLDNFLERMRAKNVIVNMTVNQKHYLKNKAKIEQYMSQNLVNGLGISVINFDKEFVQEICSSQYKDRIVFHLIVGLINEKDLSKLYDKDFKILLLGYKELGRGNQYMEQNFEQINENKIWLKNNLTDLFKRFAIVSFDNLAIKQTDLKAKVGEKMWQTIYMGDDSVFTFYIDLVEQTFSSSSLTKENERYPLLDNVEEMFEKIKKEWGR